MATTKKTYGDIVDPDNKIGNYNESTGGGTPIKKGEKIDYHAKNSEDADRYRATHPSSVVRVDQPRDEEGHFTYNSANKKTRRFEAHGNGTEAERDSHKRAAASSKSQIPPWLRNVEATFAKKSGRAALVQDDKAYKLPEGMTLEEFVDGYKEYKADTGFGKVSLESIAKGRGGKISETTTISAFFGAGEYSARKDKMKGGKNKYIKKTDKPISTPSSSPSITEADIEKAKSQPSWFVAKYRAQVDEIRKMADEKGVDIKPITLAKLFADGTFKSFDEVKATVQEYEG